MVPKIDGAALPVGSHQQGADALDTRGILGREGNERAGVAARRHHLGQGTAKDRNDDGAGVLGTVLGQDDKGGEMHHSPCVSRMSLRCWMPTS